MNNMIFGPYLAAKSRIYISVMTCEWLGCWTLHSTCFDFVATPSARTPMIAFIFSMYSLAEQRRACFIHSTLPLFGIPAVSLPDQLPFLISQLPVDRDDSLFSATERLFSVVNGYTNGDATPPPGTPNGTEVVHPERQVSTDRQTDRRTNQPACHQPQCCVWSGR
jgi:hypothetical protein